MAKRKLKKITLHPITSFVLLIVGVIRNGMDILGINTYFQQILQAVIILVAVYIDGKVNRKNK